jgi:hypothetical protein
MIKMLCFDLDGTIANLYGVPNWLEKLRAEDISPYLSACPMWDMDKLNEVLHMLQISGWEISVITWLAKDSSNEYKNAVRKAKKSWLEKWDFPYNHFYGIQYGRTKADSIRNSADYAILIDDNAKIRKGWHLGKTIDPTSEDLIDELFKLKEF